MSATQEVKAAVSDVVSVFHNSSEVLKQMIKKHRIAINTQQGFEEKQLYNSLVSSEKQISLRYAEDLDEVGDLIRIGDAIAWERLQAIASVMFSELLSSLQMAVKNKNASINLTSLHELSILSKRDAIIALDELKQRISIRELSTPQSKGGDDPSLNDGIIESNQQQVKSAFNPGKLTSDSYIPPAITFPSQDDTKKSRHGSRWRFKQNEGNKNVSTESVPTLSHTSADMNFFSSYKKTLNVEGESSGPSQSKSDRLSKLKQRLKQTELSPILTSMQPSSFDGIFELPAAPLNLMKRTAEVFWQNFDLLVLYQGAIGRLPYDTFIKSHNTLLGNFLKDIRLYNTADFSSELQLEAAQILRHRSHRQEISEYIYNYGYSRSNIAEASGDQDLKRSDIPGSSSKVQDEQGINTRQIELEDVTESESSDEEVEFNPPPMELHALTYLLQDGLAFQILKINLCSLVYPVRAISEALHNRFRDQALTNLICRQFDRVAIGDYAWLKELDATGYTKEEISQLLLEESTDSPLIYFTHRNTITALEYNPEFHVTDCAHTGQKDTIPPLGYLTALDDNGIHEIVQELCGLAGVIPFCREKDLWNGILYFDHDKTIVSVTYAAPGTEIDDTQRLLQRSNHTLENLLRAVGAFQKQGMCCNTYSVLVHENIPRFYPTDDPGPVVLRQLDLKSIIRLSNETHVLQKLLSMQSKKWELERAAFQDIQEAAVGVLGALGTGNFPPFQQLSFRHTIHVVALAAQFASLAFLSYSQAHVAPIQPFYLDTAQEEVKLLGTYEDGKAPFKIYADTTRLSCIGDMLRSPVVVFSVSPPHNRGFFMPRDQKYDLVATAEDLLDTWDDGSLLVPADGSEGYFAIQLCGGLIAPASKLKEKLVGTDADVLFHWSSDNNTTSFECTFSVEEHIRIGGFVTLNDSCAIDEDQSWRSSAPAFEILGVRDNIWRHDESQFGGQVGQYALLQYNRTKHKIPGTTLKTVILRSIRSKAHFARYNLDDLWGVQVSFCTGVARRVPLRILMADLMPIVTQTMPRGREMWGQLHQHKVEEAFRSDSVFTWLENLEPDLGNFIDILMREVLLTLESTGVDEEEHELTVAWVLQRPPYQCFRVSCSDKKNSWMRVLTDSGDCATFAYIVTQCLETPTIKCRGPSPNWHSTAPILETAVLRHNLQPSQPLGPLEHKKAYFFRKPDSLLQVTVERQRVSGDVNLYVSPSSIPAKFRQRLYNLERMRSQVSTIRERRGCGETGAEAVAILTKAESGI